MRRFLSIVVALLVFTAASAAVANPKESDKKKELPKSGNLSTSINSGSVSSSVPDPFGGIEIGEGEGSPISGSISRLDEDTWQMRVFNNSQDTYSVNLGVKQRDEDGRTLKSDSFSYTLKPGSSAERPIQAASGSREADLDLRSYSKIKKQKAAPESEAGSAATQ